MRRTSRRARPIPHHAPSSAISHRPQPARLLGVCILPVPPQETPKSLSQKPGAQSQRLRSNRHIVVAMDLKETARVLYEEWAAVTASQNGAPSKRPTCGWPAGCRISTCRRRATNLFSLNRGWDILPRTNIGHSFADQRTLVS